MIEIIKTENNEVKLMDENGIIVTEPDFEEVDESELCMLDGLTLEKVRVHSFVEN